MVIRVEGFFYTRGERFFIQPAAKFSAAAAADDMVVYRETDISRQAPSRCDASVFREARPPASILTESALKQLGPPKRLKIATDADFEYVNTLGGAAAANAEFLASSIWPRASMSAN